MQARTLRDRPAVLKTAYTSMVELLRARGYTVTQL